MLYMCYLSIQDLTAGDGVQNIDPYFVDSKTKVASVFSALFLCGLLLWSFIEYCLHRFLFHLINHVPADDPFWITIHFFLHGQHHKVRDCFVPSSFSRFLFKDTVGLEFLRTI